MPKPSILPEWATGVTAAVIEPSLANKQAGWSTAKPPHQWLNWWMKTVYDWISWLSVEVSSPPVLLQAIGDLSTFPVAQNFDVWRVPVDKTINFVELIAGNTPSSGSYTVDVLYKTSLGGTWTTLYTAKAKPIVVGTGSNAYTVQSGTSLPDVVSLSAGTYVTWRFVSQPGPGNEDLTIILR